MRREVEGDNKINTEGETLIASATPSYRHLADWLPEPAHSYLLKTKFEELLSIKCLQNVAYYLHKYAQDNSERQQATACFNRGGKAHIKTLGLIWGVNKQRAVL